MDAAKEELFAEKIAKLLRKAENPGVGEAEAEAFILKAQELMTQYAIDEALVQRKRDANLRVEEPIVEDKITYTGIYHPALFDIGWAIAETQGCKVLISKGGNKTTLHIVGLESDVARAKMFDSSVQIQAAGAMMRWWNSKRDEMSWASGSEKYKARRQFFFSFASGLRVKLTAAAKAGQKAAEEAEAKRVGDAKQAADSVALVVRSKKERVDDWYDERYGKPTKSSRRNYASGGFGARDAGFKAGKNADLGGGGRIRGGNGGELNA